MKSDLLLETSPAVRLDANGQPAFTDRGTRLTFDRELVTDDQILAVVRHMAAKFSQPLTLTGDCQIFLRRMARTCAQQGIEVENPELQDYMEEVVALQAAAKVVPFQATASSRSTDSALR
jgi:hypothetical protein